MRFASFATQLQIRRQKYPSRQAEEANASTSDITQALNSQFPQRNSERSQHKRDIRGQCKELSNSWFTERTFRNTIELFAYLKSLCGQICDKK